MTQWSLYYLDGFGADAGHVSVSDDQGFVSAVTAWGEFSLQPYEAGDKGSYDVFSGDNSRVATFVCDESGPSFRFVVRDESAAPVFHVSHMGGMTERIRGVFDIAQVNNLKLGQLHKRRRVLNDSDETKVICEGYEMTLALRDPDLIDVRAVAAVPLVMAIHEGDPHREDRNDQRPSGGLLDFLDT